MRVQKINVVVLEAYTYGSDFHPPNDLEYYNERFLDQQTKSMLWGLERLRKSNGDSSKKTGLIIATETGPYIAVKRVVEQEREKGFVGINPSYFPFIMPSTLLTYGSQAIDNHNVVSVFYCNDDYCALKSVALQLYSRRCELCYLAILRRAGGVSVACLELDDSNGCTEYDMRREHEWRVNI